MPTMHIHRDYERQRVVTEVGREDRLDFGLQTGPVAIPPIENYVLKDGDRLAQAVHPDVGDERVEWLVLQERKNVRQRMKFEGGHDADLPSAVAPTARAASCGSGVGGCRGT